MLFSQPGFIAHENFTISERVLGIYEHHYRFYMHSGSEFTVKTCFVNSAVIVPSTYLYLVKGDGYYDGEYLNSGSKSVIDAYNIQYACTRNITEFSFSIESADFYYLVLYTDTPSVLYLEVEMSFYRVHYATYDDSVTSSCALLSSNYGSVCSLDVPLRTNSYALLTISPASSNVAVDRFDEIPIETYCEPRLWVFIVPPLFLLGILIPACCCCYWNLHYKQFLCCNVKCICYCIPYLLVIFLVSIFLGLRFTIAVSYSNEGQSYGPIDTRLIPFSKTFCQSLSLQSNYNGSDEYDISFFMLSSKPLLFELENHTISETIAAKIRQQYLFYMHSGSHITVHACFAESTEVVPFTSLYIVKGIHEYNGGYLKSDTKSIVAEFAISYDCENNSLSYHIEDDDFYYLIFQASVFGMAPVLHLNVIMSFNSTHYTIQPNSTVDSCTINFGSACSLSVPLSSERYALLSIHPLSSNVNLLEKIPLETHCKPRLWVYVLPPVSLMLLLSITCAISCYARKRCKKTVTIQLASGHELNFVKSKFKQDWIKGTAPDVKAVFAINNKTLTKWKWLAYRLLRGRREWYYHGTKICCNIRSSQHLCKGADCGICGISRFGFKKSKIRDPNTTFQRFGPGFYLAPNSSKAADDRYTQGSRAILLCDVRPGKKLRLKRNNSRVLWCKWQSIYGEPGVDLNYPEIVLSNPAAILPKYIVFY
jgi:hypothetical protein